MRQVIAIGGGGFGRTQESKLIEQYILDQTSQVKPNICFIPTATGDLDPYIVNYYSVFSKLNCHPSHISFFKRTIDLEEHIAKQDIIFVGGGNTKSMLAVWKEWKLDKMLLKAYQNGKILCGVSAGAICWFEQGITDSWASNLNTMDCLGFIDGMACPHYQEEKDRRPSVHKLLKNKNAISGYAIDGGAAVHFKKGEYYKSLQFYSNSNVYKVSLVDGNVNESQLDIDKLEP
jgi:aminopeptidase N